MQMLAEGGYIIGKLATIIYPGIEVKGTTAEAIIKTTELLQQENTTLHEAAIQSGQKIIRIDILKKTGNIFELIEVKAKSFDGDDNDASEKKNMEAYIEDVVFQTIVLQEAFPKATIESYLLMPDKSKRTEIEGLASWFNVLPQIESTTGKFNKVEVEFVVKDNQDYESKRQLILNDSLLQLLPLNDKVVKLSPVIQNRIAKFLRILNSDFVYETDDYKIDKNCKSCEYKAGEADLRDGFKECWGEMADVSPHIFDLYYGGGIGHYTKGFYYDELIAQKKVSLYDIDSERLKKTDGEYGSRAIRQILQIDNTRKNEEWHSDSIKSSLESWQYPLHFIDFETYTGAIPYHHIMRPYEVIAFQWSCHTIHKPGEEPVHNEWINTEQSFPNFRFAESLMNQIGDKGTPLMWATHENTVLRAILGQMEVFGYENEVLKDWLSNTTKDDDMGREGRLVDMNAFTFQHYFHPYMKGKTSIKKTLPAIWNYHPYLHEIPWFKIYCKTDEAGNILDPYQTLKQIFADQSPEDIIAGKELEEVVKEGSAAMKAYRDMMYGDPSQKEKIKRQLLEYCKLDTMAMVIIWEHWKTLV